MADVVHCQSIFNRNGAICGAGSREPTDILLHDGTQSPPITCPECIERLHRD